MTSVEPLASALARLDQLFRSDDWLHSVGGELVSWGEGAAEVRLETAARHRNFTGTVHGGVLFSLADVALSFASNSWGRQSVALCIETQFLRPAAAGRTMVAVAAEHSRTRRVGGYTIRIHDPIRPSRLVASFQATTFRTDDWHFGDALWPEAWRSSH